MEKESFVIKKRWVESINALDETMQLEIYKALADFGLTGEMPKDISPVCHALLISFSAEIQYNDAKYRASIENGKLGGRPKKETQDLKTETQENPTNEEENPSETQENPTITQQNPSETQENPAQTLYDYDYDIDYDFSQSKKKYKYLSERMHTGASREELTEYFKDLYKDYFSYWGRDEKFVKIFNETITTMTMSLFTAYDAGEIVFNRKHYSLDEFLKILSLIELDDLRRIIFQAVNNDEIRNLYFYLLGALIYCAEEKLALIEKKRERKRRLT